GKVEVPALRGLNMTVNEGEFVSIMGRSGSGKTTLLNLVGGLDEPTAGSILVGDIEVTALPTPQLIEFRRRTVGHIFQTLNLIPMLTAAENIELRMLAAGIPSGRRTERVKALLEVVGLTGRAHHKPEELSGGEQQRVALAAALANDPPVILADEPTGELDSVNAKIVVDYLVKVNRELGKTIVMVTHDPNVAKAADRILRIEDGVIKASFAPSEVMREATLVSYADHLKARIVDIDSQLKRLSESFRTGKIAEDRYVEERQRLTQTKTVLQDELMLHG
ncbi:MAG: ABC transporter ATP-binding protein, partial [Candidatus Hadarchaeum sp.]